MNPEFLSGEASASPAVEPLLAGARALAESGHGAGAVAARNGPRVTTHANVPFSMLTAQEFVEVADYDPHLDRLLCIGPRAPHPLAGMFALMFRAKKEIGAMVLVQAPAAEGIPVAARGRTQLESAMNALEALRGRDAVSWDRHVLATGRTVREAFANARAALGGGAA